ncbi:MAG: hypothetical protein ACRDK4_15030 [Solirubrobacteraceae bacterium]
MIAVRSAKSASESAKLAEETAASAAASATSSAATQQAAEDQLALARREHERIEADLARKPMVDHITPSQIENRPGEAAPERTVRIGFTNSGNKALEDGLLTILIDPGSDAELTDRWGTQTGKGRDDETIERWPRPDGIPRAFDYFALPMRVPAGISIVRYVRIGRQGRFSLRVKLFSTELDGDGLWADAVIVVDQDGKAHIDDLSEANGPFAGRHADFATTELYSD